MTVTVNQQGVFTLSLDLELAWGKVQNQAFQKYEPYYQQARQVIDSLLNLMVRYEIRATWATVGHLFLDHCAAKNGLKHPEIIRPTYEWFEGDWLHSDPSSNIDDAPSWYGADMIEQIKNCPVPQEIGSHTFSHIIVGDSGCSVACFESELAACQAVARQAGLPELKSFVFPRNSIGHLDALARYGFVCYRGPGPKWYDPKASLWWKLAYLIDGFLILPPPTFLPEWQAGLWNIPSSYLYVHRLGWGGWFPISFRVVKVRQGLKNAVKKGQIFHLWFHPSDLATDPEGLLAGLTQIFQSVDRWRAKGKLKNLTMSEIAHKLDQE